MLKATHSAHADNIALALYNVRQPFWAMQGHLER